MGQIDITVTQEAEDIDGTAVWSPANFGAFGSCTGGTGSYTSCVASGAFGPSTETKTCNEPFNQMAAGTRNFVYNTNSGSRSRSRTCIFQSGPSGDGAAGTCTDSGGIARAIGYTEVDTDPCTQSTTGPHACTAINPAIGSKDVDGTATEGTPYDTGSASMQVTSYTHGNFGSWAPAASSKPLGEVFTQIRTRPTFESKTASTISQVADCIKQSDPDCGGDAGTCSGYAIGTGTVPKPDREVIAASGPTSVTPTGSGSPSTGGNGGRETRGQTGTLSYSGTFTYTNGPTNSAIGTNTGTWGPVAPGTSVNWSATYNANSGYQYAGGASSTTFSGSATASANGNITIDLTSEGGSNGNDPTPSITYSITNDGDSSFTWTNGQATGGDEHTITVLYSPNTATLSHNIPSPWSVDTSDHDGDGDTDIYVTASAATSAGASGTYKVWITQDSSKFFNVTLTVDPLTTGWAFSGCFLGNVVCTLEEGGEYSDEASCITANSGSCP